MTDRPALPDAELRETLDLLSTVVASVSDRVDSQSEALDRLTKTAAETRQAAFAAYKATDWEQSGRIIEGKIDRATDAALRKLQMIDDTAAATAKALDVSMNLFKAHRGEYRRLRGEKTRARHWGAAGCLLGLLLGVLLALRLMPFIVGWEPACTLANGDWRTAGSGGRVCMFRDRP